MDKINAAKNVDEYLTQFPVDVRTALEKLRKTIKQAAPNAEECISYAMPAYKYKGVLVYFAGYKNHIGFYGTPNGHEAFKKELSSYKSGKGSVQFPLNKPLPLQLISQIVKFRVAVNEEISAAKRPVKAAVKKSATVNFTDEEKVKAWLNELEPAIKKEIESVRKIIKEASPKLKERIKWNAPSYYYKDDILTFGPYKTHKLMLVFHHPAIVHVKSNLLEGKYKDRRLVNFKDINEAKKNKIELQKIIKEMINIIDKK